MVSNAVLESVFALQDNYTAAIRKIIQSQEDYEEQQKQIDKATEIFQARLNNMGAASGSASGGIGKLASKIGALVSITYLAKKGFDAMWASVNVSAMQQMQETTFGALLNDFGAGSAVYGWISEYAKTSMLGREDLSKGMTTFLTFSRDMDQLQRMVQMTERLYAKDPTQGAEGAVFALKEILSGDTLSMRNRFGITGFSGESIRNKMNSGDVTGALDEIEAVMNKFGASQAVVDANFKNMTVQMDMFKTNVISAFGEEATPLMEQFSEAWGRLNERFAAGEFQPAIEALTKGFSALGTVALWTAENINWLIPVVGGAVTAIAAYNGVMAVAAVLNIAALGPYALLAAAVLGVATAFGLAGGSANSFNNALGNAPSLEDAYARSEEALSKLPDITNSAPLNVKGSVEVEQESLKYLMDFAGMRYFASYSHVVPQMVMNNPQISQEADWEKGFELFTNFIAKDYSGQPAGMGAGA